MLKLSEIQYTEREIVLPFINSLPHTPRDEVTRNSTSFPPLRILPLGDSITYGVETDNPPPPKNGYRKPLRDRLTAAGAQVDFVGTLHSGDMADDENEGHRGHTIDGIKPYLDRALAFEPNVILLHIATNDLNKNMSVPPYDEAPQRLGVLLDLILAKSPDAAVLVAKIIHSGNPVTDKRITTFNQAVPAVVKARADKGFKVEVVDQSTVQATELSDHLHP